MCLSKSESICLYPGTYTKVSPIVYDWRQKIGPSKLFVQCRVIVNMFLDSHLIWPFTLHSEGCQQHTIQRKKPFISHSYKKIWLNLKYILFSVLPAILWKPLWKIQKILRLIMKKISRWRKLAKDIWTQLVIQLHWNDKHQGAKRVVTV